MLEKVKSFLIKHNLQDKVVIVGFSGGYDSMCLLDILHKLSLTEEFEDLKIIAAHFNHNWRGKESLAEQRACEDFAKSKKIEFHTQTAPANLKKTENDARIARYSFFEEAFDIYDADAVLTAHNKDDNAETLIYRIIKGTGLVGLKGIAEKRGIFYRPLLTIPRADIEKYCIDNNLSPNCDSSNSDIHYKRNYIRLSIIPALEKINPSVKDSINILSSVACSEDAIVEEYLTSVKEKVFVDERIVPSEYKKLSEQVKKRLIHDFLQNLNIDYDYKKISDIYSFIESNINSKNGLTISLTTALWLYVDEKIIEVIPPRNKSKILQKKNETNISDVGEYRLENGKVLSIRQFEEDSIFVFPESTANFAYIDLSNTNFPLTLRTRNDGDIINPFGMNGSMKLKKYLSEKAIPRHKRDEILLLADGNEILWVSGVGLSNKIAVKERPTHVIELR